MRRVWVHHVLPPLLAALPVVAAVLVFAAVPAAARRDYVSRLGESAVDWVILGLGFPLFLAQVGLSWQALRWRGGGFDERPDRWLTHLSQAAEWFPLLGLIGTVAAILQTFGSILPGTQPTPQEIIRKYAPAITATGSGLFMALVNILPAWVAAAGRDLILALAGDPPGVVPLTRSAPADGAVRGGRA